MRGEGKERAMRALVRFVVFGVVGVVVGVIVERVLIGGKVVLEMTSAMVYGFVVQMCVQSIGEMGGIWELGERRGGAMRRVMVWLWLVVVKMEMLVGRMAVVYWGSLGEEWGGWSEGWRVVFDVVGLGVLMVLVWVGYEVGFGIRMWGEDGMREVLGKRAMKWGMVGVILGVVVMEMGEVLGMGEMLMGVGERVLWMLGLMMVYAGSMKPFFVGEGAGGGEEPVVRVRHGGEVGVDEGGKAESGQERDGGGEVRAELGAGFVGELGGVE